MGVIIKGNFELMGSPILNCPPIVGTVVANQLPLHPMGAGQLPQTPWEKWTQPGSGCHGWALHLCPSSPQFLPPSPPWMMTPVPVVWLTVWQSPGPSTCDPLQPALEVPFGTFMTLAPVGRAYPSIRANKIGPLIWIGLHWLQWGLCPVDWLTPHPEAVHIIALWVQS